MSDLDWFQRTGLFCPSRRQHCLMRRTCFEVVATIIVKEFRLVILIPWGSLEIMFQLSSNFRIFTVEWTIEPVLEIGHRLFRLG